MPLCQAFAVPGHVPTRHLALALVTTPPADAGVACYLLNARQSRSARCRLLVIAASAGSFL
jgi:hypothetical protein